jgi:hypothetical protein
MFVFQVTAMTQKTNAYLIMASYRAEPPVLLITITAPLITITAPLITITAPPTLTT